MKTISNKNYEEERALYALCDAEVVSCTFSGQADGESALKETRNIKVKNCDFKLRYPLWHCLGFELENCSMTDTCRAALWYSKDGAISFCKLHGIKCLRECDNIRLSECEIVSKEFGWNCRGLEIKDTKLDSEYAFFGTQDIVVDNLDLTGKYSFQYTNNVTIENSVLDTKDAFWHAENVTVKNCTVKGEYLAWYSKNVTFIDCKIIGTQPLCYCKGLKLINCTTELADFAFEYSEVEADIKGGIVSVKNPLSGYIVADSIGKIISDGSIYASSCKVGTR